MSAVFDRYAAGGGEMLLALALADVSRDDGVLMLNDSVPELARKTRQTVRGVRLQLRRMEHAGWLQPVKVSDGGRGRVSTYRISPEWLAGGEPVPPPAGDAPAKAPAMRNPERGSGFAKPETRNAATETRNAATVNPEPRSGAYRPIEPNTLIPPNPPLVPKGGKAKAVSIKPRRAPSEALTLRQWLAQRNAAGEHAIAEDDPVYAYASSVGIGDDLVALQWAEFKARRGEGRKRQADWRATFRNSVRGNWFKLWFIAAGQPAQLTTTGRQAVAALEAKQREVDAAQAVPA